MTLTGRPGSPYIAGVMNTNTLADLAAAVAAAALEVNAAGLAYAAAEKEMYAAGCTPEAIKAARAVRHKLAAAKGKLTAASNALWLAEHAAK